MRQIILRLVVALLTLSVGVGLSFLWKALYPSEARIEPVTTQTILVAQHPAPIAVEVDPPLSVHIPTLWGGVLNGRAISLPAPPYPAIARAARAQGVVTVQVVVDEEGRVLSARALSGHPLLQRAAAQAAYQARFGQTMLRGQPVRVSGILTYDFAPE